MYYNIFYDITAVLLLFMILAARAKYLNANTKVSKSFLAVVILAIIACCFDIFSAICYEDTVPINDQWMVVIETNYLLLAMYTCFLQLKAVCDRVEYESPLFIGLNFIGIASVTILLIINIGPHFMFEYDDHTFVGHPAFNLIYIVNALLFVEMAEVILRKAKKLRRKTLILTSSMFFFPIGCILLQFLDDRLLLSGIGATAALLMYSFTLGDEDYNSLQTTMEELNGSKEAEQQVREEAESANRVKSLFMENISNEFRAPIEDVLVLAEKMREDKADAPLDEYVDMINEAGATLLSFVDELIEASRSDVEDLDISNINS